MPAAIILLSLFVSVYIAGITMALLDDVSIVRPIVLMVSGNNIIFIISSNTCIQALRFISRESKIPRLELESNPQPHISGVILYTS